MPRRFKPPWTTERIPGGYVVKDATGQSLAYVYGRETRADADTANVLSMDEARRIASNIANAPFSAARRSPSPAGHPPGLNRLPRERRRRLTQRLPRLPGVIAKPSPKAPVRAPSSCSLIVALAYSIQPSNSVNHCFIGGPGRARTSNQTVMSRRL
jgi:hypothetical protein